VFVEGIGTVNRQQLQAALHEENIREDACDLNGGSLPETYTLGERWQMGGVLQRTRLGVR
jgi:hypothetical protein